MMSVRSAIVAICRFYTFVCGAWFVSATLWHLLSDGAILLKARAAPEAADPTAMLILLGWSVASMVTAMTAEGE